MNTPEAQEFRRIDCYNSSQKILLVGEGDFSFSACLARALHSADNIVATSYHTENLQVMKHWTSLQHLQELKSLGCLLLYEVDVYNMHTHPVLKGMKFDIIIYNFPHAGHFFMHETNMILIKMHRELVGAYFKSASKMLNEGGEVHLRHRDDSPYDQWNVVLLAGEAGLKLKEKVRFWMFDYPRYTNIRGGDIRTNETFPISNAFTFKFSLDLPDGGDDHHSKNDEVSDHSLSKKDELVHASDPMIKDHEHNDDDLLKEAEVLVQEMEDKVHEKHVKNEVDDDIVKRSQDEVDDDSYAQDYFSKILEVGDDANAVSDIKVSVLEISRVVVDDVKVSVLEMNDESDIRKQDKVDVENDLPKKVEACVDLDFHVIQAKDHGREERIKNQQVDVVNEIEGLSILDVTIDQDHDSHGDATEIKDYIHGELADNDGN